MTKTLNPVNPVCLFGLQLPIHGLSLAPWMLVPALLVDPGKSGRAEVPAYRRMYSTMKASQPWEE